MSNELSLFSGGTDIANIDEMADALETSASEGASSDLPDGGIYINFSGKRGVYTMGQDGDDADPGEMWLVNIGSIEEGYVCWKGGQPVAKRFASVYGPKLAAPDPAEHGPFDSARGEGWFSARAMMIRSVDRGIQGLFQTNTKSAVNEFAKLQRAIAAQMKAKEPRWAVIQLHKEGFVAQGQKNFKPIFHIVGWLSDDQLQEMSAMEDLDDVAEFVVAAVQEQQTSKPSEASSGAPTGRRRRAAL